MKSSYKVLAVVLIAAEILIGYAVSVNFVVQPTEEKYLKTVEAKEVFSDD